MEPMKLSFGVLIVYLNQVILQMKDPRLASNGTKYTITDAVLGAFSMFFMQSESFLEHQRHMKSNQGKSNAQTLFGMIKIPTVPQIRNILDEIPATAILGVFNQVYWLKYLDGIGEVKKLEIKQWHQNSREVYSYQYVNGIPLRDAQPAIKVNWCKIIHTRESDGEILYENAFITRHELNKQSVPLVAAAGRCRWKTENENHNVLKTKGYHLEHNFGHGQQHLAACLLTLNLLAFLFHTVLHLTDLAYQQIRHQRVTRQGFFQDIFTLTKYLLFESWPSLINFMLDGATSHLVANSS